MGAMSTGNPDPPNSAPVPARSVWRLLIRALLWLLGASVSPFVTGFVIGFAVAAYEGALRRPAAPPSRVAVALACGYVLQLVILIAARRGALAVGNGDRAVGV